eukprot:scpid47612/ scgid23031/ Regulator of nonsense transcripts 1 homolog; ATP-dependent helicase UPF1
MVPCLAVRRAIVNRRCRLGESRGVLPFWVSSQIRRQTAAPQPVDQFDAPQESGDLGCTEPARKYFQDHALADVQPTVFQTPHDFRKYNRAAVHDQEAEQGETETRRRGGRFVTISEFKRLTEELVSCTLEAWRVGAACSERQEHIHGLPVAVTARNSTAYNGLVKFLPHPGNVQARGGKEQQCEVIIQDRRGDESIELAGDTFSITSVRASLPAERMLEAVDKLASVEASYARIVMDRGNEKKASQRLPNPDLYFEVMARPPPVSEQLLPRLLGVWKTAKESRSTLGGKCSPGAKPLTDVQRAVVKKVFQQSLTLIQGPPGTGKSTVAGEIVVRCKETMLGDQEDGSKARILLLSPSNIASDNLARIADARGLRTVRVNAENRRKETSEPIPDDIRHLCLEHRVVQLLKAEKARFGDSVPHFMDNAGVTGNLDLFVEEAYRRRPDSPDLLQAFHRLRNMYESKVLERCHVIVTTCSSSALSTVRSYEYPVIIVDEATQGIEAEVLLAVVQCPRHLVLLGDQCQLGPALGSSVSLFERLVLAGHRAELLVTQYRMHPTLVDFSNRVLYGGKLVSGITAADRQHTAQRFPWPVTTGGKAGSTSPMLFLAVDGHDNRTNKMSYENEAEGGWVVRALSRILNCGVAPADVGVITPYSCQRSHILSRLRTECPQAKGVEVGSVDGFQGREKDYIIISCVRSNRSDSIGFVGDVRRLNVALTRAKRGLIILGNPKTLCRYPLWNDLLHQFQINGSLMVGSTLDALQPYPMKFTCQGYRFNLKNSISRH